MTVARKKHVKPSGFTLVELLVVVSIIALLIALLLPALNKARDVTQQVRCLANQRQLGVFMQVYAQEHRGVYMLSINRFKNNAGQWKKTPWSYTLAEFLDQEVTELDGYRRCTTMAKKVKVNHVLHRSYPLNGHFGYWTGMNNDGSPKWKGQTMRARRSTEFDRPSETPTFFDGSTGWDAYTPYYQLSKFFKSDGTGQLRQNLHVETGANFGYLDGHAAFVEQRFQATDYRLGMTWKPAGDNTNQGPSNPP